MGHVIVRQSFRFSGLKFSTLQLHVFINYMYITIEDIYNNLWFRLNAPNTFHLFEVWKLNSVSFNIYLFIILLLLILLVKVLMYY